MKWMPISLRNSSRFLTRFGLRFIPAASLFLSALVGFLAFSSSLARAGEYDTLLQNIESDLNTLNNYIRNYMGTGEQPYTTSSLTGELTESVQNQEAYLEALDNYIHGRSIGTIAYTRKGTLPYFLDAILYSLCGQELPTSVSKSLPEHISDVKSKQDSANALLQSMLDKLDDVTNALAALSGVGGTNLINIVPTNIVNITLNGEDVLAANPWWATNSLFAINRSKYSSAYPKASGSSIYTFPQFMSRWSALLTLSPSPTFPSSTQLENYWHNFYGRSRSVAISEGYPYTWFDFMGDWQKSNAIAASSYNSSLLSALRGVSNAVDDSAEYVVNHFDYGMEDVTNLLGQVVHALVEAHGDNPWWWTNSAFAMDWDQWSPVVPRPYTRDYHTFPEAFSEWLSARQNFLNDPSDHSPSALFDTFGVGGQNETKNLYTFEDWLADSIKSNMVLIGRFNATNASQILSTDPAAYRMARDVEDEETEGRRQLAEQMDTTSDLMDSSSEEELEHPVWTPQDPYAPIRTKIESVQNQLDSKMPEFNETGNPVIVLFNADSGTPMDSAGRVSVNLNETMGEWVNTCGNVMSWLWRVLNAVLTLVLVVRLYHEIGEAI